jgi:hypothetical protein
MKDILLQIINDDSTYNKSATRYLYKTHPDVWQQILEKTSFLPDTALAKQRVWHIVNDVYEIPLCPVENIPVKWWENRYLTTSSRTAKQKYKWRNGDYANGYTPEINEKRRQGNLAAVVHGRKYRSKESYTESQKEKNKQTCIKRYGVTNGSKSNDAREKVSNSRIKNGATPKHLRPLRRLYYDAVWRFTEQSWKTHFDQINPARLDRSHNALDHIYSIQQGYRDCIPPYIIGHYTNLRVISLSENSIKGMRCDKSQVELFDHFFACITQHVML